MSLAEGRYLRQQHVFPDDRRQASALVELCGESCPLTSLALKAGAAALGLPLIASDHHGPAFARGHWLRGDHMVVTKTINHDALTYQFLDPQTVGDDLRLLAQRYEHLTLVVHLSDPDLAEAALARVRSAIHSPVLLVLTTAAGVLVWRAAGDDEPTSAVGTGPRSDATGAPTMDQSILAAGLVLGEVIAGSPTAGGAHPGLVAFYSTSRPRRVDVPFRMPLADLWRELRRPLPPAPASFTGRHVVLVGAGALGNWAALGMVLDGRLSIEVVDGDPAVETHNLNRQILLVHGVGRPKAPVLAGELSGLDPAGRYTARVRTVHDVKDLSALQPEDILVAAPDNDACRWTCADAARQGGLLFAQGGTSAAGGQATIHQPGRACFGCVTGLARAGRSSTPTADDGAAGSCWLAARDSVVSSNMVVAGLMVSELRQALAGGRTANIRFDAGNGDGNRLRRMPADPPCPHAGPVTAEVRR